VRPRLRCCRAIASTRSERPPSPLLRAEPGKRLGQVLRRLLNQPTPVGFRRRGVKVTGDGGIRETCRHSGGEYSFAASSSSRPRPLGLTPGGAGLPG
jgi:hypothetical protein